MTRNKLTILAFVVLLMIIGVTTYTYIPYEYRYIYGFIFGISSGILINIANSSKIKQNKDNNDKK